MKVTFENTPNPATLKFNFATKIADSSFEFPNVESTDTSPLAAKIFGFPWVSSVYIGQDFMTITKQDWVDWSVLATPLSGLLAEHISSGQPVFVQKVVDPDVNENDSAIVKQIKQVLKDEIRPVVAMDGGDVVFSRYENHILYIQMKGACNGCPSSQATLKDGIEVRLREAIPEIKSVEAI
jgi:NFU1 iron-sulfur cluster scaffold homolog, mitochondrial